MKDKPELKPEHLYLVMKLLTEVELYGQSVKLEGCAGFIPVYDSIKEAKKVAGKKFKIQPIAITKTIIKSV